jgi:AcrR family transcriptional regulator
MENSFSDQLPVIIQHLEQKGLVTRTFRRLDIARQMTIITAIMQESSLHGPAGMNIKKIATRAGVSIGSLYQYFNNKEGLLNFAIELAVQQTVESFNTFLPYLDQLTFKEAYSIYLSAGLEWGEAQQQFVRFFAKAAYQDHPDLADSVVKPISTCMLSIIRIMVQKGQQRGEIRSDIDTEAVARILHALSIVIGDAALLPYLNTYFQVSDETLSLSYLMDSLMDILEHGLLNSANNKGSLT